MSFLFVALNIWFSSYITAGLFDRYIIIMFLVFYR